MANFLKWLARHTIFSKNGNLTSFNDPYKVIAHLLRRQKITGIIDAGASNGRISQRFLRMFPKAFVYAFEPNPLYAEILRKKAATNKHFIPQFYALSDREHSANLHITQSPGITSLFRPGENLTRLYPQDTKVNSVIEIETVTLDRWAERNGFPGIQIMKFDIQGGELKALEGADNLLQTTTLLVYTEILFNPLYEEAAIYSDIDLSLRKRGFVLHDIFKPRYGKEHKILWANAIFVHEKRLGI
jgi:FkbM family methyltransferase